MRKRRDSDDRGQRIAELRELKKRRTRSRRGLSYGKTVRPGPIFSPFLAATPLRQTHTLYLVGALDLLSKPVETLNQLRQLDVFVESFNWPRIVSIDMQHVTQIDVGSLLYVCSRVRAIGAMAHTQVMGTYPLADDARKVLHEAEFDRFLGTMPPALDENKRCVTLEQGVGRKRTRVDTQVATSIQTFLMGRHPGLGTNDNPTEESDRLYEVVNECLENVRQYAYDSAEERHHGWYVVGLYNESSATSSVAILDLGVGIRKTALRKKEWSDLMLRSDFLEAVTSGRRTASGLSYRGRGLSGMKEFATTSPRRRFHVLSSGSMITWESPDGSADPAPISRQVGAFRGTIVCLEISSDEGS